MYSGGLFLRIKLKAKDFFFLKIGIKFINHYLSLFSGNKKSQKFRFIPQNKYRNLYLFLSQIVSVGGRLMNVKNLSQIVKVLGINLLLYKNMLLLVQSLSD